VSHNHVTIVTVTITIVLQMEGKQGSAECTYRTTARDVFHFEPGEVQAQRIQRNRNIYPLVAADSLAYIQAAVLLMDLNCCPVWARPQFEL